VQNNGFLPTYTSEKAHERGIVRPIEVEMSLPEGTTLVSGERRQDIGQLEGRSNKLFWSDSPTDNQRKVEWVLKGTPRANVELTVRSQRAGTIHRTIPLNTN
jgi:hypothetical protein